MVGKIKKKMKYIITLIGGNEVSDIGGRMSWGLFVAFEFTMLFIVVCLMIYGFSVGQNKD